jgi:hypothetical protein
MLDLEMAAILNWSCALVKKAPKVLANGMKPLVESPTAIPTMFCSAIKHSTNRSG